MDFYNYDGGRCRVIRRRWNRPEMGAEICITRGTDPLFNVARSILVAEFDRRWADGTRVRNAVRISKCSELSL
ncbi:MAG: hypothetical protein M0P69_01590 [Bacteroidales bacterium]|nr:hypothetical protein [Bacteroidales bacterium]